MHPYMHVCMCELYICIHVSMELTALAVPKSWLPVKEFAIVTRKQADSESCSRSQESQEEGRTRIRSRFQGICMRYYKKDIIKSTKKERWRDHGLFYENLLCNANSVFSYYIFQVVTLSLYAYFISALLGRQFVVRPADGSPSGKYEEPDMYFPVFTTLQVRDSNNEFEVV